MNQMKSPGTEDDPIESPGAKLISLLRKALAADLDRIKKANLSFSGGLDSSLLAGILREFGGVRGIVSGISSSVDIENAEKAAEEIDVQLEKVLMDERSVVDDAKMICRITGSRDPVFISFEIPIFASLRVSESDILISGQGADELFFGYAKYEKMTITDLKAARGRDIEKLLKTTVPHEDAIAHYFEKSIVRPYLNHEVISFAMDLPIERVYHNEERKRIIREALGLLGFSNLAKIPKKAAQYGSGALKILKNEAARRGVSLGGMLTGFGKERD